MRRFSMKLLLSPHQYFVTQGKGPERPFTGDYWWVKDVGAYHCIVCDSKLYPSHYKYFPPTGHCAFWAAEESAVKVEEQECELKCNKCESHLGHLYNDGPSPTYLHHQVKSGALLFKEKPWFQLPPTRKELRKMRGKKE